MARGAQGLCAFRDDIFVFFYLWFLLVCQGSGDVDFFGHGKMRKNNSVSVCRVSCASLWKSRKEALKFEVFVLFFVWLRLVPVLLLTSCSNLSRRQKTEDR